MLFLQGLIAGVVIGYFVVVPILRRYFPRAF